MWILKNIVTFKRVTITKPCKIADQPSNYKELAIPRVIRLTVASLKT